MSRDGGGVTRVEKSMKKNPSVPVLMFVIVVLFVQQLLTIRAPAATGRRQNDAELNKFIAKLSGRVTIRATGKTSRWLKLTDGRELTTRYIGRQSAVQTLVRNEARALSLATEDFDEDGASDLACGYAAPSGTGIVVLHLRAREHDGLLDARFFAPARAFELPAPAEFLGAGDFDADGLPDLVAGSSGGQALYLLRGDVREGFLPSEKIDLPGTITTLVAGDINRADGLADVVVGTVTGDGPQVLMFEGPHGALRSEPSIIALPAAPTSLAIGQLDGSYEYDLAAAAGTELFIVHGRERRLSARGDLEIREIGEPPLLGEDGAMEDVAPVISRIPLGYDIAAIALGNFSNDVDHRTEIAVASPEGRLQYLDRSEETWRITMETTLPSSGGSNIASSRRSLLRAKVSSLATDDLMVTDPAGRRANIITGGPGSRQPLLETTSFELEDEATAVVPLRSSWSALSDLAILSAGSAAPSLAVVAPQATFTVTNTNDSGPGSLRQAILDANASPGLDLISLNILSVQRALSPDAIPIVNPLAPLPIVSDPVSLGFSATIDPITKKVVLVLDGQRAGPGANGLTITAGNSVVQGFAIGSFEGHAISLQQGGNNVIKNNSLGTGETGTENLGNGGEGVNVQNSPNNEISGNTIVFNGDGGSLINSNGNFVKNNSLGTDNTMTRNMGNRGAGFGAANSSNNRFQFNRSFFNRVGFVGFGSIGNIFGGTDGSGNIIGRNGTGVSITNSSNNTFNGNFVGTNPLDDDLGNLGAGIEILGMSLNNKIGGDTLSAGNKIAYNDIGLFCIPGSNGNLYLNNSIYSNALPINNNNGANRGIRPPELLSAMTSTTDARIAGRVSAQLPSRSYAVFFYGDQFSIGGGAGPSVPIGAALVTTNTSGNAAFTVQVPVSIPALNISALLTDITTNDTSEASNSIPVSGTALPDLKVEKTGPLTGNCGRTATYTIRVTNVGTATAFAPTLIDKLPDCVADDVTVTSTQEGAVSYPLIDRQVATLLARIEPDTFVTITITVTFTALCPENVTNRASISAAGDPNTSNDTSESSTRVICTRITSFTTERKNVIVSGLGFAKGDQIDINGVLLKTKFRDVDELLVKKGKRELFACDPANPARTNVLRLIRRSIPDPGQPIQDTAAFATCP